MQITGNTILITGGTSGIGLAFAEQFFLSKNTVIVCGRREKRLAEIKERYPRIITKVADLAFAEQRVALAEWILQSYPDINMLINNAGIQLETDLTHPVDLDKVRSEVEINFIAPIHLTSLLARHFMIKKEAAIINISSGLAFAPLAFMPVYCATKAGVHSLTLSLRHQLKYSSVKVFEIAPPSVDTELGHERREGPHQSHGGMPISEFIQAAMNAIENDTLEAAIGGARNLREKRENIFSMINS